MAIRTAALGTAILAAAFGAHAHEDHDHGHDHHAHGHALMDVVLAGSQFRVDLRLSGEDLFGEGQAEGQGLEAARALFSEAERFVAVPAAAECELLSTDATMEVVEEEGEHHGHRDYTAFWVFSCAHPEDLTEITATALSRGTPLEEIDVAGSVNAAPLETAATVAEPVVDLTATAERRELGAHVHGEGILNIAIEGEAVAMELELPGFDAVGFEHAAESDEDRAAIAAALDILREPPMLIVLPGEAGCEVTMAEAELVGGEHHGEHEEHAEADHAHGDEHGEEHAEADHAHDEEHAEAGHDHGGESHTEFHAEYAMTCADTGAITSIEFPYFEAFGNAEKLEVQLVTDTGATAFEVERDAPSVTLSEVM